MARTKKSHPFNCSCKRCKVKRAEGRKLAAKKRRGQLVPVSREAAPVMAPHVDVTFGPHMVRENPSKRLTRSAAMERMKRRSRMIERDEPFQKRAMNRALPVVESTIAELDHWGTIEIKQGDERTIAYRIVGDLINMGLLHNQQHPSHRRDRYEIGRAHV